MKEEEYKAAAVDFLQLITQGKHEAFDTYTDATFIHHNPHFKAGRESLIKGMEEHHALFPEKKYEVKHVVGEGQLVIVHGLVQLAPVPDSKKVALVHLFRFEGEKIAELWDIGEEIPKNSPNEDGMF